jgi:hypothetical protein
MRTYLNKMKYVFFLIGLALLLVGCTAQPQNVSDQQTVPVEDVVITDVADTTPSSNNEGDITIVISNGKLTPDSITVPFGEETTIVIENQDDTTQRFQVPMYQSEVNVDVAPGTYEVVMVSPKAKGLVLMELNGASAGRVVVE